MGTLGSRYMSHQYGPSVLGLLGRALERLVELTFDAQGCFGTPRRCDMRTTKGETCGWGGRRDVRVRKAAGTEDCDQA